MTKPDQQPDSETSTDRQRFAGHVSRRTFLTSVGAAMVGAVAAELAIPASIAAAASPAASNEPWAIAAGSELFQHVIDELVAQQFVFDLNGASFQHTSDRAGLVGLTLRHRQSPSPRSGVDVVLTVDPQSRTLSAIQVIQGWCLDWSLEIHSIMFDGTIVEEYRRGVLVGTYYRRREQHWSFPRDAASATPPPSPLPLDGWPAETPDMCPWHYQGCIGMDWDTGKARTVHFGTRILEQRSCQAAQQRIIERTRQDYDWN
jgi:hypothetical protein